MGGARFDRIPGAGIELGPPVCEEVVTEAGRGGAIAAPGARFSDPPAPVLGYAEMRAPPDTARRPSRSVPFADAAPMSRATAALLTSCLAMSVLPMAWQDLTLGTTYVQADVGRNVAAGLRVFEGQVPYRDWHLIWPPLGSLVMAASFEVFGVSMVSAKIPLALFSAGSIVLAYRWLRPHASRGAAVVGAATVWGISPILMRLPFTTNMALLPAILCLQQIGRIEEGRLAVPALSAGAACGIAFGFKHNIGILLGMMIVASVSARASSPLRFGGSAIGIAFLGTLASEFVVPWRTILLTLVPVGVLAAAAALRPPPALSPAAVWRALAMAAAGGVAVTVPWAVWLARAGALDLFLRQGLLLGASSGSAWRLSYGLLLQPLVPHRAILWILAAIGMAAIACTAKGRWSWGAAATSAVLGAVAIWDAGVLAAELSSQYAAAAFLLAFAAWRTRPRAFAAAAASAWVAALSYPAMSINHTAVGLAPAVALGTALGWDVAGRRRLAARGGLVLAAALLSALGWLEWTESLVARSDRGPVLRPLARMPGARGGTWVPGHVAMGYEELLRRLDRRVPAGAPLVAWPALGLVNFLSARPNPTSMDYYWPGYLDAAFERRLLSELERARPPVVVLNAARDEIYGNGIMWRDHPAITRYVMSRYRPTDRVGDLLVLGRTDGGP